MQAAAKKVYGATQTKHVFTITTQVPNLGCQDNHYFPAGAELWLSAGGAFEGFQGGFWRESEHWAAPLSRAAMHACAPAAHS